MADVSIAYKGAVIAELNDSDTKTLKTAGTYCEGDVTVAYTKPGNTGAGTATAEDIAFGQTAWVNGVQVEGAMRRRVYTGTITETVIGQQKYAVLVKDALLGEHKDDTTLFVRVKFEIEPTPYTVVQNWGHTDLTSTPFESSGSPAYQSVLRYDANGSRNESAVNVPINTTSPASVGCMQITADGELRIYSNSASNYAIRPCNFTVVVEW